MKIVIIDSQLNWHKFFPLIFAIIGSNLEAGESERLLIRVDSTLPEKVQEYIADIAVPTTIELPAGKSIEDAIKELCGISSNIYIEKTKGLNIEQYPDLNLDAVEVSRILKFPACVRTNEPVNIEVAKGDSPIKIVEQNFGNNNSTLVNRLQEINGITNPNKDLKAGSEITLPQSLPPTSLELHSDNTISTNVISNDIKNLNESSHETSRPEINVELGNPDIQLISPLNIDNPLISDESCKNAGNNSRRSYPFDSELVTNILKKYFNDNESVKQGPTASVTIIDTGLDGFDSLFPRFWFDSTLNDTSDSGNTCDSNRYGANANIGNKGFCAFTDYQYKWHGTYVTDLVEGSAQFRNQLLPMQPYQLMRLQEFRVVTAKLQKNRDSIEKSYVIEEPGLIAAIGFVQNRHPNIVNVSLSSTFLLDWFKRIFLDKTDTLVIVAAGNNGLMLGESPVYPANYGGRDGDLNDNLITVAAHDGAKNLARFSNHAYGRADLAAPGCNLEVNNPNGIEKVYGTSFAAPLVTFTSAILYRVGIRQPSEIKNRLMAATDFNPSLRHDVWSSGTLNVTKSIAVFDDVIERKINQNSSNDEKELLFGSWEPEAGNNLKICNNRSLSRNTIVKVTPIRNSDPLRLRIVRKLNDGQLDYDMECEPEDTTTKFMKTINFNNPQTEHTENLTIHWTDVVDIVPKSLSR